MTLKTKTTHPILFQGARGGVLNSVVTSRRIQDCSWKEAPRTCLQIGAVAGGEGGTVRALVVGSTDGDWSPEGSEGEGTMGW